MLRPQPAIAETAGPRRPWGWLVILLVAAGSIWLGCRPDPESWINGRWNGTFHIDSTPRAEKELHRQGTATIKLGPESGVFSDQEHQGDGVITFLPDSTRAQFELHLLKPSSSKYQAGQPSSSEKGEAFFIKSEGGTSWSPPGDLYHSGVTGSFYGTIAPTSLHLHTLNCLDPATPACSSKYRLIIDLVPAEQVTYFGIARLTRYIIQVAEHLIFALPVVVIFYRKRLSPWRGVYFVTFFTLIAGLTFGVSWLIALAAALTSESGWSRGRALLFRRSTPNS